MRAKAHIEEAAKGRRYQIVVTELPYQINKATLVERIAELAKNKRIDGISEVRDESDREGMRIVIELRRRDRHRRFSTTSISILRCSPPSSPICWPWSMANPK